MDEAVDVVIQDTPAAAEAEQSSSPAPRPIEANVEELTEDMLHVLERLSLIERLVREQSRTIDALRSESVGHARGRALRHIFDAVAPAIDTLKILANGLDPSDSGGGYQQVVSAAATLGIVLQTLGFERFDAAPGEPFYPARMECMGYAEGAPGNVIQAVRPGYTAGDIVMRPAGVLIADPQPVSQTNNAATEAAREVV